MRRLLCTFGIILLAASAFAVTSHAQGRGGNPLRQFIKTDAPVIALTHVKTIDGTGAAPIDDQTIVISGGKIFWIGAAAQAQIPAGAQVMDLDDPSKAVDVPNLQKLQVLDGYFAWRRESEK